MILTYIFKSNEFGNAQWMPETLVRATTLNQSQWNQQSSSWLLWIFDGCPVS